ncbi:MAG: SIMPL domain-containing protein [Rickettsiales bacterium]
MSRFFRLLSLPHPRLTWMEKLWLSALVLAILMAPYLSHAEDIAVRSITVTGDAEVKKAPDKADVSISVEEENKSLEEARRLTDQQLKSLTRIAKEVGISDKDMQTSYSSIQPVYDYTDGKQVFRAYSVNHQILITLRDLSKVAVLTEKLLEAKIDNINNVSYGLQNEDASKEEALKLALAKAKSKAQGMTAALGTSLGQVLQINESGVSFQPIPVMMRAAKMAPAAMAMDAGASAPPTGEIAVNANVSVTFALKD